MKKIITGSILVAIGLSMASVVQAQVKPETLVKQRQAAMTLQSKYFYGQLRRMAQGRMPYDANVAARAAGFLEALSKMPWDGFAASTKDVKSAALPAVFSDAAKFKEAQDHYQSEVAKLVSATKNGGEAAVKAQIDVVNKACDSCHESFSEK